MSVTQENIIVPGSVTVLSQNYETWRLLQERHQREAVEAQFLAKKYGREMDAVRTINEYLDAVRTGRYQGGYYQFYWLHATIMKPVH
jgi:hypothetical protein